MQIHCPVCGTVQKVEGRECNECFCEFIKGLDGTIAPPARKFFSIVDDQEDMSKGIFSCV